MNVSALRAAGLTDHDIVRVIETVEADRRERHRITTRQNRIAKQKQRSCARDTSTYPPPPCDQAELWEPVEDAKTRLFRVGKTVLMSWGAPERTCASMIGRWLKTKDDPEGLLAAIEYARDRNVFEPIAYISALVGGRNGKNGKRSVGDVAGELAAKLAAREAGL
jgi:hypothetical protein